MKTYVCSVCGFVYDEAKTGIPWEELPEGFTCPLCGAGKSAFREQVPAAPAAPPPPPAEPSHRELSAMELSVICSNLARGCEKQYQDQAAADFARLAAHFRAQAGPAPQADVPALLALLEADLNRAYPQANTAAAEDRGARRALVWSEKVTRMLQYLLERYHQEGPAMLEHTGVYVCTICGFVFLGDAPPELCPVCKVPSWKFEKAEGRGM